MCAVLALILSTERDRRGGGGEKRHKKRKSNVQERRSQDMDTVKVQEDHCKLDVLGRMETHGKRPLCRAATVSTW